jgi:hypothetical protein
MTCEGGSAFGLAPLIAASAIHQTRQFHRAVIANVLR